MGTRKAKTTKKRGRGRPPSDNPRSAFICVRVTPRERQELARKAREAGMSLASFIMAPHRQEED